MKHNNYSFLVTIILLMVSCTSEVEETSTYVDESNVRQTAVLRLEATLENFESQTRSSSTDWEDGATLYIQYHVAYGDLVQGIATYDLDQDFWEVSWYGTIVKGQAAKCEVYYFEHPQSATTTSVELNERSLAYVDLQGSYLFENGMVTLKTNLQFKTGRLRFLGQAGTTFSVSGLKWYDAYDITANKFSSTAGDIQLTIDDNGFSPYVYTELADNTVRTITVDLGEEDYVLQKRFPYNLLTAGKSGRVTLPTMQSHNGWTLVRLDDPLGLCPNSRHPHVIDLGLPVKFSCCNVGAATPADYGDYFAWGEVEPKETYSWENYKWCKGKVNTLTKYCLSTKEGEKDDKLVLEPEDDAAHVICGGTWRMPKWNEGAKLVVDCTWTWTTIGGVNGCKVTASNGNSIFLPAAGYRSGAQYINSLGESGTYWTSRLQLPEGSGVSPLTGSAVLFYFGKGGSDYGYYSSYSRCEGRSIRPVTEE